MSVLVNKVVIFSNVRMGYIDELADNIRGSNLEVNVVYILTEYRYRLLRKNLLGLLYLRFLTYVLYPLIVAFKAIFISKNSLLIATSNTFFLPTVLYLPSLLTRSTLVSYIYDLHPEAILATEKSGRLYKIFYKYGRLLQEHQSNKVARLVFIHDKLAEQFYNIYPSVTTPYSIANVGFSPYKGNLSIHKFKEPGKIHLHYGGQLGLMHSPFLFGEIIQYLSKSPALTEKIEINIAISKVAHKYFYTDNYHLLHEPLSSINWQQYVIEKVHVGIVILNEIGSTVCFPSKLYGYVNFGLPILAICPKNSALWDEVESNNLGWVVDITDLDNLNSGIHNIIERISPHCLIEKHQCAIRYKSFVLNSQQKITNWNQIIHDSISR
jgi:hypothetical protein